MPFQQFELTRKRSSNGNRKTDAESSIMKTLSYYPGITKSMISVHVRPAHENWFDTLNELVERGIVEREVVIRKSGRATVIYRLADGIEVEE